MYRQECPIPYKYINIPYLYKRLVDQIFARRFIFSSANPVNFLNLHHLKNYYVGKTSYNYLDHSPIPSYNPIRIDHQDKKSYVRLGGLTFQGV